MNIEHPAKVPIDALRANVSVSFEESRAMPPQVYTSKEFNETELEQIFKKDWFCVGRASALAKPGDYVTCELAEQPVIVQCRMYADIVCLHYSMVVDLLKL
jgi:hypothetical protein